MTNPGYEKCTIRNFRDAKIPHCDHAQHDNSLMRRIDDAKASRPEMSQMRKLHEKLSSKVKVSYSCSFSCRRIVNRRLLLQRFFCLCELPWLQFAQNPFANFFFLLPSRKFPTCCYSPFKFAFRGHFAGDSRKGLPADGTKVLPTTGRNSGIVETTFFS